MVHTNCKATQLKYLPNQCFLLLPQIILADWVGRCTQNLLHQELHFLVRFYLASAKGLWMAADVRVFAQRLTDELFSVLTLTGLPIQHPAIGLNKSRGNYTKTLS